jgi:energy-dependent translational throttle protein EttA
MHCERSYPAYVEDLMRWKGPDADQPHRMAYEKLVRA